MQPNLSPIHKKRNRYYLTVNKKFWFSHFVSFSWLLFSIYLSIPWVKDLSDVVTMPVAIIIIGGIAYIPGYMSTFLVISLLLDKQPNFKNEFPNDPVTVLVAAYNEEGAIFNTLKYISNQDYTGEIKVIVINNNSTDATDREVMRAKKEFKSNITLLHQPKPGKFHALNLGLEYVETPYVITLDADTLIHPSAIRYLVSRIKSSPSDVSAVAGSMLVRNSRETFWTKIQEWDYFLGIASIKRLQGLYQGTLVAQGAFSLYKTDCVKEVKGWPDAIGEDIVLTWRLLQKQWKVYFEPLAVAFTDAPTTFGHFAKQRSRWARGMVEGLIEIKPWQQPQVYTKYLTGINLMMVYLDFIYTVCWIPGLILAFFGINLIVGPMTLLVLPLTFFSYSILYFYQKNYVFRNLNLRIRNNRIGFLFFLLCYQMIMSPVSLYGYIQEFFKLKRVWE
ncbi:glycosyltransferase [Bacillus sp. AFS055030]|uniref:glycosyltransferase family 2 protein n=1 Tax=Bacillus sp. AFS055030 TaxID=2033507 RepID=UPI000BFBDF13|nr:glycosyltransferase [Bacillus sp. AFS055030]PGL69510.1 glycosyl transferase [Bacillus sp. AFS055030]